MGDRHQNSMLSECLLQWFIFSNRNIILAEGIAPCTRIESLKYAIGQRITKI